MSKIMRMLVEEARRAKDGMPDPDLIEQWARDDIAQCWQEEPHRGTVMQKALVEAIASRMAARMRAAAQYATHCEDDAARWRERAEKAEAEVKGLKALGGLKVQKETVYGMPDRASTDRQFRGMINPAHERLRSDAERALMKRNLSPEQFEKLCKAFAEKEPEPLLLGTRDEPREKPKLIGDGPARFWVDVEPRAGLLRLRVDDDKGGSTQAEFREGDSLARVQATILSFHEKIGIRRKMLYG